MGNEKVTWEWAPGTIADALFTFPDGTTKIVVAKDLMYGVSTITQLLQQFQIEWDWDTKQSPVGKMTPASNGYAYTEDPAAGIVTFWGPNGQKLTVSKAQMELASMTPKQFIEHMQWQNIKLPTAAPKTAQKAALKPPPESLAQLYAEWYVPSKKAKELAIDEPIHQEEDEEVPLTKPWSSITKKNGTAEPQTLVMQTGTATGTGGLMPLASGNGTGPGGIKTPEEPVDWADLKNLLYKNVSNGVYDKSQADMKIKVQETKNKMLEYFLNKIHQDNAKIAKTPKKFQQNNLFTEPPAEEPAK